MTSHDRTSEPVDPDSRVRPPGAGGEGPVLLVVAVGGVVGALARYGAGVVWPAAPTQFPWTTFGINVLGCLLIGVLVVLVSEVFTTHRLVRPLLGTGVLGGFTTFSTYAVDAQRLIERHQAGLALVYLVATLAAALAAVTLGTRLTRVAARRRRGQVTA